MPRLERAIINHPDRDERVELRGDLAGKYLAEMKGHRDAECRHPDVEIRAQTISDGRTQCKRQCLICGAPVGSAAKKQDGLPPWNEDALNTYMDARDIAQKAIRREYIQLHEQEIAVLEAKSGDWQAQYEAYRRTPLWQAKRARVLKRANGLCEGCLEAAAVVVHHLTYANMGDELFFQLVALCRDCHTKAHPEHYEAIFYDNDYVPCDQCRWGDGGVTCGRFEIPAYQALEAGGPCGPDARAFEGLK
ncbi:HNH endonuclease [Roseinatronobacter sp. S2]|uniref:HNH endonuclease n=1 Tax=Roseinatronobacter sp. S2 TaxID=3035471 RepID=UPI0024105518|nr:hypothetical protein [Roseinatronobacter sp. S2]WFE77300.1 hypothetical protein P8S53_21075 [Roseinatronobacter sp. S2]